MQTVCRQSVASRRLHRTRRHLERMVAKAEGPPSVRLGRLRRYPESLLERWITEKVEALQEIAA